MAEVLITLGIIGVVAALTLPTFIQNYQKKVLVNQLKKSYATIQNACRMMLADEGVDSTYYLKLNTQDEKNEFIKKYFKGVVVKETHFRRRAKYYQLNGKLYTDSLDINVPSYKLPDGAEFSLSYWDRFGGYLDVNGPEKKPNKVGYDLFYFKLRDDCGSYFEDYAPWYCTASSNYGNHWYALSSCLIKVMKDGWVINYDESATGRH